MGRFVWGFYEAVYDPHNDTIRTSLKKKKKAIRNAASGAAIGTSDPSRSHAHVLADTLTIAPENEVDVAYDPNKSMHTLMEAVHTAARALGKLITKLNEMPIDVKERDCFKIVATTALKMIGFQEKDKNEDVDPIGSMTQTLMDEDEEWKDPSWVDAVEDMVTTVEKRVALCDNNGIPSFDLGIEWVSNNVSK